MLPERYSRQILLQEIGKRGQDTLKGKKAAIVGIGALGTVAAELLVRSGIGEIILIDRDCIELSNLQRQTLFTENDLERSKAYAAKEKLQEINHSSVIASFAIHLNVKNISVLDNADLIFDCTDNLQTRFLLNDYCKKNKKTWIYAAAIKTSGYVMPIIPEGPCLRCFLQEASLDTCDMVGVLNTITTTIAAMQVTLGIKLLLGKEIPSFLHRFDIWNMDFKKLKINKKNDCPTCNGNYEYLIKEESVGLVRFCGSGRYQIKGKEIDLQELKKRWERIDTVKEEGSTLRFKNIMIFADGRVLIKSGNEEEALSVYSKWVGN